MIDLPFDFPLLLCGVVVYDIRSCKKHGKVAFCAQIVSSRLWLSAFIDCFCIRLMRYEYEYTGNDVHLFNSMT